MSVDMSAKAITDRLRLASQLRALCLALGKARRSPTDSEVERQPIDESKRRPA